MDPLLTTPSSLICPKERCEKDNDGKVITVCGKSYHVISSPYCISDAEKENANDLHSLLCRNKKEGEVYGLASCLSCSKSIVEKTYYFCNDCDGNYHNVCVESPSIFQSSDHPKHPLQLVWFPALHGSHCFSCKESFGNLFYSCFVCDFIIHPVCATNPTPLTINNPKRHEHTLHYFPRKSTLVCDVCGLDNEIDYLYICLQCDFILHKRCLYLPYVIRVSRHNHRLAFTPNIPYKEWTNCGVCHTKINGNYGKYSCMKGCAYAMHTRCALRSDICDGKELEGEPEEAYGDIKMFKEEGDGIIRYSSHRHHQMRLGKQIQREYDENKHCQVCTLPFVDDGNAYRCMQCDFILHESCAYNPRVKLFMLHAHPLILNPQVGIILGLPEGWFKCKKCDRYSCGFTYACPLRRCALALDTLCASISEPFDYHSHPHSLFVTCDVNALLDCSVCKSPKQQPLSCVGCSFVLCFGCATLPHKARYEHDEHLLTFSFEEETNDDEVCLCEICEKNINPKNGLYACKECGVTLHIECLLGRDPSVKPGQSGMFRVDVIHVLANISSTRPICNTCQRRCPYKIMIQSPHLYGIFCSFDCYWKART